MKTKLACILFLLMPAAYSAEPIALQDFARTDSYDQPSVSPDGHYLAVRVPMGQQYGLAVIDMVSHKLLSKISVGADRSVVSYAWSSSSRLVFSIGENFGFAVKPVSTGEVIAINVDGKAALPIFSWRGSSISIGSKLGKEIRKNAFGDLIRTLPKDPDHVLIAATDFVSNADRVRVTAYRVNTLNGIRDQGLSAPVSGDVEFAADDDGLIRYVTGSDDHNLSVTFVRTPDQPKWRQLNVAGREHARITPLRFSSDNRFVWLTTDEETERTCLVRQDLESGERKTFSCDDIADVDRVVFNAAGDTPVAVYYEGGKPRIQVLTEDSASSKVLVKFQAAFPGQIVVPFSFTRDGHQGIIVVYSDRNPGDYYLVDTQSLKAEYVAGFRAWLDPDQAAERRPVVVKARDGALLHGFLTLPRGLPEKNLPLVLNPHGGPFDVEDTWAWDEDPQLLASRGYAVLQVNYRGSGGFGSKFVDAGKLGWDKVMIDDVTDAARWAVSEGIADAHRVCIYGASYGGYSAVRSVEREPDLYRCAVGYAGVYDLPKLASGEGLAGSTRNINYVTDFIGATPQSLVDASPVTHVDQIHAALLIVHGTQDERAPFSQAKSLRHALDEHKIPYEWLEKAEEGHGFYLPENRKAFFETLLAFLDKNIGPAAPAPPEVQKP